MTKPLFAQNVLGLTLVLYIVFIADFFLWLHIERFQNTKVRQFCLRLIVIEKSVGIIISHAVNAVFYIGNKIKALNVFVRYSNRMLNAQNMLPGPF